MPFDHLRFYIDAFPFSIAVSSTSSDIYRHAVRKIKGVLSAGHTNPHTPTMTFIGDGGITRTMPLSKFETGGRMGSGYSGPRCVQSFGLNDVSDIKVRAVVSSNVSCL